MKMKINLTIFFANFRLFLSLEHKIIRENNNPFISKSLIRRQEL